MPDTSTVRAAALTRLPDAVERLGGSFKRVLRRATVDQRCFEAPEAHIPFDTLLRILQSSVRETGDPLFVVHYTETLGPHDLGAFGYLIASSATLGAMFRTGLRYKDCYEHGTEWGFYTKKDRAAFTMWLPDRSHLDRIRYNTYYILGTMAWLQSMCRFLLGPATRPQKILLELEKPPHAAAFEYFFGVPLYFGQKVNAFVFDTSCLDARLPDADPLLHNILKHYLNLTRPHLPALGALNGPIERCIVNSVQEGHGNVLEAATRLGMSVRTLQRRLETQGLTYSAVASKTSYELALFYLKSTDMPIKQIAFLLGYTDVSNFNRAFRRWSGTSPSKVREEPFLVSTALLPGEP